MDRLLIINADDFGLSKAQNYGIIEAFHHGVVTSTTAMMNAEAIKHAAGLCARYPGLGVGMHFVLTLGRPLTEMPVLTRGEGVLGKWIWEMAEQGQLDLAEIRQELESQYQRFIDVFGIEPTHLDSHHHVHMIPEIFPIVAAFANAKGIPLRVDRDAAARDDIALTGVRSTEGFSSEFYGDAISEELLLESVDASAQRREKSLEVMCHPSFVDNTLLKSNYCYPRLAELEVLTSSALKYALAERGYRLGTFRDI
ncbi:chitin disaccharide deacetylase [Cedecea davisae]|uniref:Chitooligosaccharide deacetylase n=1 Tax=Cedecea davisae TaxID=158484 RepID=A0ABS6DMV5_9ENTR|nr:chitin disaccharide deacetylase [Cedecea davisae]MBU4684045.1 chitin disaccharide deacetylase [Cedecea davisae]MBU4689109.1 chitin disaccharide deacetylase [Cedecea davisae]